jgi:hypothetical protein
MNNEVTCINNNKRKGLQVFLEEIKRGPEAETISFFGIIWDEKEKLAKTIETLFKEAISQDWIKIKDNPEKIFENALQKLNSLLFPYLKQKNNLNLLFGLKDKNNVFFTFHGKIFSLFIDRRGRDELIVSPLQNLLESEEKLIFSKFISGTLNFHQSLFFSTDNISSYFTPLRLGTLLFSSSNALWQLKDSLAKLQPSLPFAALHIFYKKEPEITPLSSIQELTKTENQTEQIISPPLWPNLAPFWKKILNQGRNFISTILKKLMTILPKISQKISQQWQKIKSSKKQIMISPFSWTKLKLIKFREQITSQTKNFFNHLIESFNGWPFRYKILSFLFLILLFFFFQSLLYLNQTETRRREDKLLNEQIAILEKNITEAKASLIYGNEEEAQISYQKIKDSFTALSQNPRLKTKIKEELQKEINQLGQIIRREIILTPQTLFEFGNQKKPSAISLLDGDIYLLSDNSLLKLNKDKKALQVIYQNLSFNFEKFVTDNERKIIILTTKDRVIELNPKNLQTTERIISLNNLESLASYNHRLYLLFGNPKTINRLTPTNNGFVSTVWLREKINLQSSLSLTVDGDIYLLFQNGEVIKLTQGYKKDFTLSTIDPPFISPSKILTYPKSNYLYLLETHRIVVFDKKGKLINQYLIENLGNLTDFAVDEPNKKLYLLTDKGVFEAGLNFK